MAPKRRIRPKQPHKSKRNISSHKVHKRKLRSALLDKTKRTREKTQAPKRVPTPTSHSIKPPDNAGCLPARGSGRPSRFDLDEEEFLKNVPEQLKQYAFRPGNQAAKGHGRPKDSVGLTTRLRGLLATPIEGRAHPKGKAKVTYADELMSLALQAARRGDYRFFQHIYERVEGKIPDHLVVEEVQQLVAQESEKVTEDVVRIVTEVALAQLGEKRAAVFGEELRTQLTEKLGEKDAGLRAS